MIGIVAAAVLSTQTIDGSAVADGGDYDLATFEVPDGAVEITVSRVVADDANILDFGVVSPDGIRGWGGGLKEDAVIGIDESSRGYLPGPLPSGQWTIVIGKAKLAIVPADYQITVTIRNDATLTVRPRAPLEDSAIESGARWYAGDLHVHSNESGDATATFEQIADLANDRGLDFVVLSDHNTISQHALAEAFQSGRDGAPLFIRGNEVTSYSGHGNALGAAAIVDHKVGLGGVSAETVIADVAAAGGKFVINHPTLELGGACIGCAWEAPVTPWEMVAAIEIHTGPFSTAPLFSPAARDMWDAALDDGHRVTAVGGSDDHRAGIDLSSTQSPIGSPTTLVFAEELSEAAIIEGIARGRVVVLMAGPTDPSVELEIESDTGELGRIGDSIRGDALVVRAHISGGDGSTAVLVTSGEPGEVRDVVGSQATIEWNEKVDGDARYRVHVFVDGQLTTVTNHVFVDFEAGSTSGCGCSSGGGGRGMLFFVVLAALSLRIKRRRSKR